MRRLSLLLGLVLLLTGLASAETAYIDNVRIPIRRGAGIEYKIIGFLDVGAPVEFIQEDQGWARIKLPGDKVGWVVKRYLTDKPPRLERVKDLDQVRQELGQEISRLQSANQVLRENNEHLQANLSEPLPTGPGAASSPEELVRAYDLASRLLDQEQARLRSLKSSTEGGHDLVVWFLTGAGLAGVGMVMGFVTSRIRLPGRKAW